MTLGLGFTAFFVYPFPVFFFMVLSFSLLEQWCAFLQALGYRVTAAAAEGRNPALFTLTNQHVVFVGLTVSVYYQHDRI